MRSVGVARHEAAHAAVGVYLGLTMRKAVVGGHPSDPTWQGYARFVYRPSKRLAFGVMTQAGPAGDMIHGTSEFGHGGAWDGDIRLANAYGFFSNDILMLRDLARFYLQGPCAWAWRRVTAALLERDVKGAEVKRLLLHREPIDLG